MTNPGRATSAEATSPAPASPRRDSASASAMSSGDRRIGRASFMARLVAKSPKVTLAGRSTSMAGADVGSSSAGSRPAATASAQARSTAARTRARMAAGAATGSAGMVTGDLLAGLDGTDAILPPGPVPKVMGPVRRPALPRTGPIEKVRAIRCGSNRISWAKGSHRDRLRSCPQTWCNSGAVNERRPPRHPRVVGSRNRRHEGHHDGRGQDGRCSRRCARRSPTATSTSCARACGCSPRRSWRPR